MIRALHFVFKIGDRGATAKFYRQLLGMQFLRHEEFTAGCEAACNGPYNGRWSKSMVGYGDEATHFVIELTYNYEIASYLRGNDFFGITIRSDAVLQRVKQQADQDSQLELQPNGSGVTISSPDGHPFHIMPGSCTASEDPVKRVTLASSNLQRTIEYWVNLLHFGIVSRQETDAAVVLAPSEGQCELEFKQINGQVQHAKAFGRIAFSCPRADLKPIQDKCEKAGEKILTPLISLDTPGKATVEVVILADPDGHEICFVGDEAFRELSAVDPKADVLLDEALAADKSSEWFGKRGGKGASE